jgi:hypothetical protein
MVAPRNCRREVMASFANTFRKCHSTVCALMNNCAAISGFVKPSPASRAMTHVRERVLSELPGAADAAEETQAVNSAAA